MFTPLQDVWPDASQVSVTLKAGANVDFSTLATGSTLFQVLGGLSKHGNRRSSNHSFSDIQ